MITKEKLKKYANNLMFEMSDEEYETLENEFEIILKQMDLIDKIEGINNVEPMTFPFINCNASPRENVMGNSLTIDEVLQNTTNQLNNQVKVPKVVE